MWNTWTFYQCIIVHISSTSPCYSGNDTFLKRKGDEERFLWNHPSASAHTPSGPPLVPQTIDTWAQICQMRLESSLKWPRVEYSSDSSRTCSKKWRPNPPTTKVYKKSFHIFCFHCLGEIRVLISGSSEGSSLIFVTCLGRSGQVTIPWLKWLTDALASEPILQIWPRGFSVKPGRVRWRPWKIIMAREDSWMYLLSISFGSKCHSLAKVWDPWLTLLSLAWKPHYCWLCNQLFII